MESGNLFDIRALSAMLKENDSGGESDADDGQRNVSSLRNPSSLPLSYYPKYFQSQFKQFPSDPGTIGSSKKDDSKSSSSTTKEERENGKTVQESKETIWSSGELPGVTGSNAGIRIPDISNDPRQRPEVDVKYMQDVTTEDVFLGVILLFDLTWIQHEPKARPECLHRQHFNSIKMSNKTPGSTSCGWILVKINMTGETDHNSFHLDLKENWIELRSKLYALIHVLPHRINPRVGQMNWGSS